MRVTSLACCGLLFVAGILPTAAETANELSKEAENALAQRDLRQAAQRVKAIAEQQQRTPEDRYCPKKVEIDEQTALSYPYNDFYSMVADSRRYHEAQTSSDEEKRKYAQGMVARSVAYNKEAMSRWASPDCLLRDGRSRLSFMSSGFIAALKAEKDWNKAYETVGYFKEYYAGEPVSFLLEPIYWNRYAWDARGNGFASTVSDDGWRLFKERMARADKLLQDSKESASVMPVWYEEMLDVALYMGRDSQDLHRIFIEGATRFPSYYPIYFNYLISLLPKWGGNWQSVDELARWSVEHTKATEGHALYARIYWVAASNSDRGIRLFHDTSASWKTMKLGFEDMMKQYPESQWNRNAYAGFACIADDKAAYSRQRKLIGKQLMPYAWPDSVTPAVCDYKFGLKPS